jgi:hypothetical protein
MTITDAEAAAILQRVTETARRAAAEARYGSL